MRNWTLLVAALSLLASSSFACAETATGSLTVAFAAEPTVMDPSRSSAGVDAYYFTQLFEPLVRFDPELKPINWLAESWKVEGTDDKPIIDVHLRGGVKFHNGDPMTAADFEFCYQRMKDPKITRFSHLQANVEKFEIVDDLHFRLHFSAPDGEYVAGSLQLFAMPKKYFDQVGEDAFQKAPVGTGPWKFVSRTVKDELKLEAFDDYWNKKERPTVKNLTIKIIPEDLTRVAAFKTGTVDWIDAVPLSEIENLKKMPGVKTFSAISGNNLYVDFPSYQPTSPFNKLKVRQAVAHAIDMDAIIKTVLFGQGERYEEIGKGSTGYDPELKPYAHDPKLARKLLAEAGYPKGFETPCYNLTTQREPNIKEYGEAVFAYLGAVGIRCKVQGLEYSAWINLGRRGRNGPPEMDGVLMWMWGQRLPGDPGTAFAGHLHSFVPGKGFGAYSYTDDKQADALVLELNAAMDPAKREAAAKKAARYAHDNVLGGITTYRPVVTFAWRDKVTFRPWPTANWRNFQELGLKQ